MNVTSLANLIAATQFAPSLSEPLSVAKSQFSGRLGYGSPVIGQAALQGRTHTEMLL
jgi:hypothetical protein